MSDMAEENLSDGTTINPDDTIILAGRVVGFIAPTQGQMEAMIRIARTIARGSDDDTTDFWHKQIDRIGTLLESMIAEGDRDTVDQLYLTGKIDHTTLMTTIMAKVNANAVKSEDKAIAKAKANVARVRRK
jgi:hypothetical protein